MGESSKYPMMPARYAGPSHDLSEAASSAAAETWPLPDQLLGKVEYIAVGKLKAYRLNARRHSKKQLRKIAASIQAFGFVVPVLVDANETLIAGHGRVQAAELLGLSEVPVIRLSHLNEAQVRALRIADNRLTELGEWDETKLAIELQFLVEIDFDVELTGFDAPEIDMTIERELAATAAGPADSIPPLDPETPLVSRVGDIWLLDDHRLICGDARDAACFEALMRGQLAQLVFTDPPYNVAIDGHVCGSGRIRHSEFVMASGEMSEAEYEDFLVAVVRNLIRFSANGSVHYLFIDWRHLHELEGVCRRYFTDQLNLCIWSKTNGGMGSLYRSQHELVLVYKNGTASHINNIHLGKYGRNRTNVWTYEGVNTVNPDRRGDLELHPTVKPVALVADAIRDCSKRNGIVLDPFVGSGTTIIAAEETGRICYAIELDPRYVDTAIRRWETFTGGAAQHGGTGLTFNELALVRSSKVPLLPPPHSGCRDSDGGGA